jgi:DNA replication protein DnaC
LSQSFFLDELGDAPIDKRETNLLFQVVAARYESGSIVISTDRTFREWGALFDVGNIVATALIDWVDASRGREQYLTNRLSYLNVIIGIDYS